MGAVATFSWETFNTRYPEFSNVSSVQAQAFFNEATLYFDNSGTGPVTDPNAQLMLLNMVTAHIAMLSVGTAAQPASGLVGRISSATQGSVSVSTDLSGAPGTAAWFAQTSYGLNFWQATAPLRTMHYRPGPSRLCTGDIGQRRWGW